jgi:hypothetical protein
MGLGHVVCLDDSKVGGYITVVTFRVCDQELWWIVNVFLTGQF